ncbi:MAG TPA: ammonium transporter [Candidatus Hydrogenedentes bacterium]|nr:ammonium transporter [Candidatus Hydrogenedentota bacterium]HNT87877.1 ammonium transporter [Candidatus Hydrogenedentota bacterium]
MKKLLSTTRNDGIRVGLLLATLLFAWTLDGAALPTPEDAVAALKEGLVAGADVAALVEAAKAKAEEIIASVGEEAAAAALAARLSASEQAALVVGNLADDAMGAPQFALDTIWVMIAGFLVFWMNAGFALVESGFARAKNCVNILAKNFIVFAISAITFWISGFALMFGDGNLVVGLRGFFLNGVDFSPLMDDLYIGVYSSISWAGVPLEAKFFFQLVFACTAATIVSGAVAERIKFQAYLIFAAILVAVMYPITGHWIWGGGWLGDILGTNFMDFAGSTVVHSVGGWAALVGVLFLGPRLGKYRPDGGINAIPGHNITSATLGGLILWLGWFGFNPGSTMAADGGAIAHIATTTAMAASAGAAAAAFYAWARLGTPDLSMIINGSLAGLVAITAPCDGVSIFGSLVIGLIAGVLVVESVLTFDKLHVDDPVGATSVHLVNGVWGTLAVGLFNTEVGLFYGGGATQLIVQAIGVAAVGAFTVIASVIFWGAVKASVGMRVTPEEEYMGLDQSEMGLEAYPEDATTSEYRMAQA